VPVNADDYVHRIGRTGRAGRKGTAVMLVTGGDDKQFGAVLKTTGMEEIEELELKEFFEGYKDDDRPARSSRSGGRGSSERGEKTERPERAERSSERGRGRGRGRRDDGPAMSHADDVKGFGDHVPDFMKVA
jgi:ATP-dependent RNA helicase RhlE